MKYRIEKETKSFRLLKQNVTWSKRFITSMKSEGIVTYKKWRKYYILLTSLEIKYTKEIANLKLDLKESEVSKR